MASASDPDLVLLIHGTGAANVADTGAAWWQAGSPVSLALRDRFGAGAALSTKIFHWSGKNSEYDRRQAALSLLDLLVQQEAAQRPYHLIGHSHGGSVIWLALQEATASGKRLDHLRSWATLGTPFLNFRPQPVAWSRFLPALAMFGLVVDFIALRRGSHILSPWSVGDMLPLLPELWRSGEYAVLVLFPLLWLVLLAVLLRCAAYAFVLIRSRRASRSSEALKLRAFESYSRGYLGVWSPNDEAINGLTATLLLAGEVAPKWQPDARRGLFRRVLDAVTWPVRGLYNAIFARAADELIWSQVATHLQGNDTSGLELGFVSRSPSSVSVGWPAIPDELDRLLVAKANEGAATILASLRTALGMSVTAGAGSPNIITGMAAQINLRDLVHTSYYTSEPIQDLLACHVRAKASPRDSAAQTPAASSELRDWYFENLPRAIGRPAGTSPPSPAVSPKIRTLTRIEGIGLAAMVLVIWTALLGISRASLDVLTDRYQVDVVMTRSRDIVPSVFYSSAFGWLQALAAAGELDRARHDAAGLSGIDDGEKVESLAVIAATLRAIGNAATAATIEEEAVAAAQEVTDTQAKTRGIAALAGELASNGILREDLLQPDLLSFSPASVLATLTKRFAAAGYPDQALKILPQGLDARAYAEAIAPVLKALLDKGRTVEAMDLARKVAMDSSFFTAPVVMEVYAASGDFAGAETVAAAIQDETTRTRAFARLALLWIKAGDPAKCLAAAARVNSWTYVFRDAAQTAAALAKAGRAADAKTLALKALQDQSDDNPWWDAQQIIDNQRDLADAGIAAEVSAARSKLFAASVKKYGSGDTEVLGRAVYRLIGVGDVKGAYAYVRSFPTGEQRAAFLPVVSVAFADAQDGVMAQQVLAEAETEIAGIEGESDRSSGIGALAQAFAHAHRYRDARLRADNVLVQADRLAIYAAILRGHAIDRYPRYKSLLKDPDTLIVTNPF
ncbi:hypothetical protein JQ543_32170 [Bradyrhizobium diazoefficiens]|nr:hypothetical protein [Bradyrhizobium diazoefficiens]MBR0852425.1 hypothetical protein [Bradyrhizobium diazoefficiens]